MQVLGSDLSRLKSKNSAHHPVVVTVNTPHISQSRVYIMLRDTTALPWYPLYSINNVLMYQALRVVITFRKIAPLPPKSQYCFAFPTS